MDVDFSRHLSRFLHVDIVVEEVLKCGHLPERLQLVPVARSFCGESFLWFRLRSHSNDALDRRLLLLCVERSLSLVVPELPGRLAAVAILRQELHRFRVGCGLQIRDGGLVHRDC